MLVGNSLLNYYGYRSAYNADEKQTFEIIRAYKITSNEMKVKLIFLSKKGMLIASVETL